MTSPYEPQRLPTPQAPPQIRSPSSHPSDASGRPQTERITEGVTQMNQFMLCPDCCGTGEVEDSDDQHLSECWRCGGKGEFCRVCHEIEEDCHCTDEDWNAWQEQRRQRLREIEAEAERDLAGYDPGDVE